MHAFAGASCTLFTPALATGLRVLPIQELLSEFAHVTTVLYISKVVCRQFKFVASIVNYFVIGHATRPHRANRTSF
jgi:hypothetical protein